MTDPRRNDPNYPPRYWSGQPPLGATAHTSGHQATTQPPQQGGHGYAPGHGYGLSPIPEQQRVGAHPQPTSPTARYEKSQAAYGAGPAARSIPEQGRFEMSPIPGDVPSPYQPASAHPPPPTPAYAGPYTTPPLPAGYMRSVPQPMPGATSRAGPPSYGQVGQGYTCPICLTVVPAHLEREHKQTHAPPAAPRVGLGYPSNVYTRGDDQGQGSSSSNSQPSFFARR